MRTNETILVVEDDHDLLTAVCAVLTVEGFRVEGVGDIESAHDFLRRESPGVMLLDLFLHGRLCDDFIDSLATSPTAPPLVLCSATHATGARYSDWYEVAFLPKPFDVDELIDVIDDAQRVGRRPSRPMRAALPLLG